MQNLSALFLKKQNNAKGFTLIELLVVIVIIGILASMAVVGLIKYNQTQELKVDVEDIENNIQSAKSLAFSRVNTNPQTGLEYCGAGTTFTGYYFTFINGTGKDYELAVACKDDTLGTISPVVVKTYSLSNTTVAPPDASILFSIDGLTSGTSSITVTSVQTGATKTISISPSGVTQIN